MKTPTDTTTEYAESLARFQRGHTCIEWHTSGRCQVCWRPMTYWSDALGQYVTVPASER